jgi:hypothetical protein
MVFRKPQQGKGDIFSLKGDGSATISGWKLSDNSIYTDNLNEFTMDLSNLYQHGNGGGPFVSTGS